MKLFSVPTLCLLAIATSIRAATFGDQTGYTSNGAIKDAVLALRSAPAESGVCDSVTIYLKLSFDSCKVKCALYTTSGNDTILVTNGVTEERRFATNAAFTWQGFAFIGTKPAVTAGVDYFIAAFADTAGAETGGFARVAINTSGPGAVVQRNANYESGLPDPLNPSTAILNYKMSAYVTFTPTTVSASPRRRRIVVP